MKTIKDINFNEQFVTKESLDNLVTARLTNKDASVMVWEKLADMNSGILARSIFANILHVFQHDETVLVGNF